MCGENRRGDSSYPIVTAMAHFSRHVDFMKGYRKGLRDLEISVAGFLSKDANNPTWDFLGSVSGVGVAESEGQDAIENAVSLTFDVANGFWGTTVDVVFESGNGLSLKVRAAKFPEGECPESGSYIRGEAAVLREPYGVLRGEATGVKRCGIYARSLGVYSIDVKIVSGSDKIGIHVGGCESR